MDVATLDPAEAGLLGPSPLEAHAFPDDAAAWARTVAPGSAVVASLAVLEPERMSAPARVDALIAYEQVTAWLQARQLRVLAVMAADPMLSSVAPELDKRWVKEDVRAALGESAVGAGNRLDLATQLTTQLPATLTALEHGQLTMRQARHLADAVLDLDDAPARAVQTAVLPGAAGQDLATFGRHVHRAVLAADPRTAAEAHADELAKRRIAIMPGEHGMGTLFGYLPADALQAIITALDVKADQCPTDDPRTKDQQRADALTQLAIDALNGHPGCPMRRLRPSRHRHRQQHRVQPSTTAPDPTIGRTRPPPHRPRRDPAPRNGRAYAPRSR